MKITKITARSKRTLPHPTKSFANFGADFELTANLDDNDDPNECIEKLRKECENLCEQHCADVRYGLIHGEEIRSNVEKLEAARRRVEELEQKLETIDMPLFAVPGKDEQ